MLLKRAACALAILLGATIAHAQTTPSNLQTSVDALPWTNGQGALTGANIQALWNQNIQVFETWAAPLSSTTTINGVSCGLQLSCTIATGSGLQVNAQTGTTYTVLASDQSKLVTFSNASAVAVTLPQATGSFAAGFCWSPENKGVGTVTITPTTSTINGASTLALTTKQGVIVCSDGTNYQIGYAGLGGGGITAGSGLTLTGSVMSLGDSNLTYSAGYVTLGASSLTGGIKVNTFNPNINANPNDNTSFSETCSVQSYGNVNLNPLFTDSNCRELSINTNSVDSVYSAGNTNGQTLGKNTSLALNEVGNYLGAGQKILHGYRATCFGMSDCAISSSFVTFAGGPIAGDEGQGFTEVNTLQQQQFLSLSTITSIPAQSTCNTTLTQAVAAAAAPQAVTVASTTGCNVNDWVVVGQQIPLTTSNEEAVQITGVGGGAITGIFRHNFNQKLIATLGSITGGTGGTPGTYTNGGAGIPLTGGTGTGATAVSITVGGGGSVTAVTLGGIGFGTNGSGYTVGDVLTASSGLIGGTTGFSVPVATTQGNTVTPAKVLVFDSTFQTGQDRVMVDISRTPVTAGTVSSITNNAYTGSSTSWSVGMVGGNATNIGCILLTADDDNQSPFNGSGANGTLHSYYEILSVSSTTALTIHSNSAAGDTSYTGRGPGSGGYAIYPCARLLYIGNASGVPGLAVLETSSTTWTVGDTVETAINPYPDVSGFQYHLSGYTPGGAWRSFMDVENNGHTQFQFGMIISSQINRSGLPFTKPAWGEGLLINQADTGLRIGPTIYGRAILLTQGTAGSGDCPADDCGNIEWGASPGQLFIGPNSTNLALQINWAGAARSLMTVIDTNSGLITGNHDLLKWPGGIQNPADASTNYQACGTAMRDTIAVMTSGTAVQGATVTAGSLHVVALCNELNNWTVVGGHP